MHYADYYEEVELADLGKVRATGRYMVGDFEKTYEGYADTVTLAHAKLREFRQEFRKSLKEPK